jgi:hypothetical protein
MLVAFEAKATNIPFPLIAGRVPSPSPWTPFVARLAITVVPAARSRTNTSNRPFESPGTRFVANEANATRFPSALIEGVALELFPSVSFEATLTTSVVRVVNARTKMCRCPFVPPGIRFDASDTNATARPSSLIDG